MKQIIAAIVIFLTLLVALAAEAVKESERITFERSACEWVHDSKEFSYYICSRKIK